MSLSRERLNEIKNGFQYVFKFYAALFEKKGLDVESQICVHCSANGEKFTICAQINKSDGYANIFIFKGKNDLESLSPEERLTADIFEDTGDSVCRYLVRVPNGVPDDVFVRGMKLLAKRVLDESHKILDDVKMIR